MGRNHLDTEKYGKADFNFWNACTVDKMSVRIRTFFQYAVKYRTVQIVVYFVDTYGYTVQSQFERYTRKTTAHDRVALPPNCENVFCRSSRGPKASPNPFREVSCTFLMYSYLNKLLTPVCSPQWSVPVRKSSKNIRIESVSGIRLMFNRIIVVDFRTDHPRHFFFSYFPIVILLTPQMCIIGTILNSYTTGLFI